MNKRTPRALLIILQALVLAGLLGGPIRAQDTDSAYYTTSPALPFPGDTPGEVAVPFEAGAETSRNVQFLKNKGRRISISVVDMDVQRVLKLLADQVGVNILIDPNILDNESDAANTDTAQNYQDTAAANTETPSPQGTTIIRTTGKVTNRQITLDLQDMAFVDALELVLTAENLWYVVLRDTLFISTRERIAEETGSVIIKFIPMQYSDATMTRDLIKAMNFYPPPLAVEVYDSPDSSDKKDQDSSLTIGRGEFGAEGRGVSAFRNTQRNLPRDEINSSRKNILIIKGFPETVSQIEQFVLGYDRPPRQVVIETMVVEITDNGLRDMGINGTSALTGQWTRVSGTFDGTIDMQGQTGNGLNLNLGNKATDLPQDITAVLRALIQKGHAKLLNNTTIATLDGTPAAIEVGTDEPIVTGDLQQDANGNPITTYNVDFRRVGVSLVLTPRVDDNNSITLAVNPIVSEKVREDFELNNAGGGLAIKSPVVGVREANTIVRVKTGQQVVIGGLIKHREIKTESQVPFISRLPIVGKLFRNRHTETEKTEVIIVITPRVVNDLPEHEQELWEKESK